MQGERSTDGVQRGLHKKGRRDDVRVEGRHPGVEVWGTGVWDGGQRKSYPEATPYTCMSSRLQMLSVLDGMTPGAFCSLLLACPYARLAPR